MESGDKIDLIYGARLELGALSFSLISYFTGSRGAPWVSCSITTTGVNGQDLAPAIEAAEKVTSPSAEFSQDGVVGHLKWTFGAADGNDRLEMIFRRDERRLAALNLTYQIRTQ